MSVLEDFKKLTDFESVATYLDVSTKQLGCYLHHLSLKRRYKTFQIPKKDGTLRTIHAPCRKLKDIQKKLSDKLLKIYEEIHENRKDVVGFRLKHSIVDGAKRHLHRQYVVNVDLEDFFTQITFPRVRGLFIAEPFKLPPDAATILAQICTFLPLEENGANKGDTAQQEKKLPYLPQGAPTSPVISNFILSRLDHQLHGFARNKHINYSRYADDLTFSVNSGFTLPFLGGFATNGFELSNALRKIIVDDNHLKINEAKIRCYDNRKRQVVTGLTVNKKANVSRHYLSQLRAMLHDWGVHDEKVATEKHLREYEERIKAKEGKYTIRRIVEGKLAFLKQVVGEEAWTYRQLKFQYDYLTGENEPVIFSKSSKWLDIGVYVIEDELEIAQGTAFSLKGCGLVTNAHVLHDSRAIQDLSKEDGIDNLEKQLFIYRHGDKKQKRLRLLTIDRNVDFAVLRIVGEKQTPCFDYSIEEKNIGDKVLVAGYPNYNNEEMTLTNATIKGQRVIEGIIHYEIDRPIIIGNSGGPVFDMDGRVIGIATRGGKSEEDAVHAYNLILPISYVINDPQVNCLRTN